MSGGCWSLCCSECDPGVSGQEPFHRGVSRAHWHCGHLCLRGTAVRGCGLYGHYILWFIWPLYTVVYMAIIYCGLCSHYILWFIWPLYTAVLIQDCFQGGGYWSVGGQLGQGSGTGIVHVTRHGHVICDSWSCDM